MCAYHHLICDDLHLVCSDQHRMFTDHHFFITVHQVRYFFTLLHLMVFINFSADAHVFQYLPVNTL